uniref:Molybdopterin synthase catalytic subunit n=1 Tax=Anopheles merus TaxID=30066 RepID=A0A182UU42_ANOME
MSNTDSVRVKLLFFAKSRELAGVSGTDDFLVPHAEIKCSELLDLICNRYNLSIIRNNVILAHNEQYCADLSETIRIRDGDELALTFDKLDVGALNDQVAHESCGAVSLFVGTTRDNFEGKTVVLLEYEAYEAMAIKTMNLLCEEVRARWPDVVNIGIHHRLGTVPVKEASVVIAISSPHRKSSLEAVHFTIDELKKSVPVWKKELYDGEGSSEWKENSECTWSKKHKDNHIL